jgi:hypothetical protein
MLSISVTIDELWRALMTMRYGRVFREGHMTLRSSISISVYQRSCSFWFMFMYHSPRLRARHCETKSLKSHVLLIGGMDITGVF